MLSQNENINNRILTMSVCAHVLALPELLEQILLSLPPKDALLSQRVNTTFRDTTSSIHIQRHFFFHLSTTLLPSGDPNPLLLAPKQDPWWHHMTLPGIKRTVFDAAVPTARLCLFDIDVDQAQQFLSSEASCLDMYLHHSDGDIAMTVYHTDEGEIIEMHTGITVRVMTLRGLLTIKVAVSDNRAATELLAKQEAVEKSEAVVEGAGTAWKTSLSAELVSLVVEGPRVEDDL